MNEQQTVILLEELHKKFHIQNTEDNSLHILRGLNLEIKKGSFVSIVGKSGAGKSTLLHIIGLIDTATSGRIIFNGEDIINISDRAKALFRNREIGFIFQFHYLLKDFTALENVLIPSKIYSAKMKENEVRAKELLTELGLQNRFFHHPGKLSGGEKQRVAIARALMNDPSIILADEPTGNLDEFTQDEVIQMFLNIIREHNKTLILVTHNLELAQRADKMYELHNGVLNVKSE